MTENLYRRCFAALCETDTDRKLALTAQLQEDVLAGRIAIEAEATAPEPVPDPGRPARPALVSPLAVERRNVHDPLGRAALIHALAHIEFNAINLALDAVYRFRELPPDYVRDWLRVAAEEALHFRLLRDHLRTLGSDYGAFPAHNGLWDMAVKTAHDPLVRMALVPRVLEARGLDALPAILAKLRAVGDAAAVSILEIVQRDEIEHVRIGTDWYHYLCRQRKLDPLSTFRDLLHQYRAPRVRPSFERAARHAAGFSDQELEVLSEYADIHAAPQK